MDSQRFLCSSGISDTCGGDTGQSKWQETSLRAPPLLPPAWLG